MFVTKHLLLPLLFVGVSECSHFRGGTASWKHLSTNGQSHQIEVNFRLGWRRDAFPVCDDDTIQNQVVGYDGGDWRISGASSPDIPHSVAFICTTYEPDENWAYGYNSFTAIVTSPNFNIHFSGGAWIGGMYFGGGSWNLPMNNIDLAVRSDTGQTNIPPSTLTAPVVRLQLGCPLTIVIPTTDEDGDKVTCRYAVTDAECGGICGEFPYFTLKEETCTIEYDGGGGVYLVPVALMIEDHSSQTITVGGNTKTTSDPLSSIPLQFLVDISTAAACNVKPSYPETSIPDNSTVIVEEDGTFNDTIDVYPSRPGIEIKFCVVIGPVGMHSSGVIYYGNDLYGCIITWTPSNEQVGDFIVCYYAVDEDGFQSDQRCFTITVSDIHPCDAESKGGCSDTCVKSNSTYTCSCEKTCWNLHGDGHTCIPDAQLTCDGDNIDLEIPLCVTQEPIYIDQVSNPNAECQSVISNSSHQFHFGNDECGVSIESSAVGVHYKTNVYIYHGVYVSGITRGEWIEVPMTCTLPASSNLTGSFVPEIPISGDFLPETVYIEGMGSFTFYFDFYKDSDFSSIYGPADLPVELTVQEYLHFILGAVGSGALEFFTESCVASSERDLDQSALQYPFIVDGCLADPTMDSHTPATAMENRFSIQAFQFSDKLEATPENAEVFIQCAVVICDINSLAPTRCSQGCLGSSTRRSNNYKHSSIVRFKSNAIPKVDSFEEEEIPPKMEIKQSPPQDVVNSFSLIIDPDDNVDDDDDDGNDGTRVSSMLWVNILTLANFVFFY